MDNINELKKLISTIRTKAVNEQKLLIIIEGSLGSGKSFVSEKLMNELGYDYCNLDKYINDEVFLSNYNYNEHLNNGGSIFTDLDRITDLIYNANNPLLLDCIFVRDLLVHSNALQSIKTLSIYIKRCNDIGYWMDGDDCDFDDLDQKITEEREKGVPLMREESLRYHFRYKPHKIADIVFSNIFSK